MRTRVWDQAEGQAEGAFPERRVRLERRGRGERRRWKAYWVCKGLCCRGYGTNKGE